MNTEGKEEAMGAEKPQVTATQATSPLAAMELSELQKQRAICYAEIESARYRLSAWDQQVQKLEEVAYFRKQIAALDAEIKRREDAATAAATPKQDQK